MIYLLYVVIFYYFINNMFVFGFGGHFAHVWIWWNMLVSTFAERIDYLIKKLGGVGKACIAADISPPTLIRWKDGTSDPKLSNLSAFAKAAGVSLDWLIYGDNAELTHETHIKSTATTTDDNYCYIPAYDIEVSAGHGMFTAGTTQARKHMAFRQRYISQRGFEIKKLAVLFTKGDSMTPTIPENATILVDLRHKQALDGKVYVIRIDDRLYVKRTQWTPQAGGLRLISDNKQYDSFDINEKDSAANNIEIIGQVVHAAYDLPD